MTTANTGRKPKPTKLKVLEGVREGRDSGGRAIPETPEFRRLPPLKPSELSPVAAEHWDLLIDELGRLELTKPLDAGSLAVLCETWARWHDAQRLIRREGLLSTNSQGLVRHPAVAIVEAASKEYRAWASEFGLTPSAEGRLGAKEKPSVGENPFGRSEAQS
jgi:P27 family predicted phage terminase small subunit